MNGFIIIFVLPWAIALLYAILFFTGHRFKLNKYILAYAEIWYLIFLPYLCLGIEWGMPYSDKFPHFFPEPILPFVSTITAASVIVYFTLKLKRNVTRNFQFIAMFLLAAGIVINIWMLIPLSWLWLFFNLPIVLLFVIALVKVTMKLLPPIDDLSDAKITL